jgi:acetyltransferase-like isoleucine patch superfamily enzyme
MKLKIFYFSKVLYNKIILLYNTFCFGYFKGKNVHIIGNVIIKNKVVIGDNSTITSGNNGFIEIQQNCSLGKGLWLGSGDGNILIEKECLFGPNVTIVSQNHATTSFINSNNYLPWERDSEAFNTIIGQRCHLGANVVILPGTKLGDYCTVGANAVLKGTYESGSLIVGNPAKVIKIININYPIVETKASSFPPHRHLSKKFF